GTGRFTLSPLPTLAQMSPGFGVAIEDFDGDGNLDAVIAQNFYDPQPETGRMSGGLGVFLRGNGDGSFTEVWPQESGIEIHEDAKSLAIGDLNNDGAPDLVCGINNGNVVSLVNQTRAPTARWTTVHLKGLPGNPTAIGASLSILTSEGRTLRREVRAGSGYLSQSTPKQFVALKLDEYISEVNVTWPTGREEVIAFDGFSTKHLLQEPKE
ncbi:MAG: CRTAC1 family protein, partial [Verrucomicrobiota bacterium]